MIVVVHWDANYALFANRYKRSGHTDTDTDTFRDPAGAAASAVRAPSVIKGELLNFYCVIFIIVMPWAWASAGGMGATGRVSGCLRLCAFCKGCSVSVLGLQHLGLSLGLGLHFFCRLNRGEMLMRFFASHRVTVTASREPGLVWSGPAWLGLCGTLET